MGLIHGFEPISGPLARCLVLGTMPSKASLRAGQYYANPQNRFWRLVGAALGIEFSADYEERIAQLVAAKLAVWDVLRSCRRESSLDSDIDAASAVPNDFAAFFARHRALRRVYFNGATAEALYRVRVLPTLPEGLRLAYQRLPSTSPANASIPHAQKLRAWRAIARGARGGPAD